MIELIVAGLAGMGVGAAIIAVIAARGFSRHPDSLMLEYIELNEHNLFFNDQVDGGAWGVLAQDHKLIAAAPTLRSAIQSARIKEVEAQS